MSEILSESTLPKNFIAFESLPNFVNYVLVDAVVERYNKAYGTALDTFQVVQELSKFGYKIVGIPHKENSVAHQQQSVKSQVEKKLKDNWLQYIAPRVQEGWKEQPSTQEQEEAQSLVEIFLGNKKCENSLDQQQYDFIRQQFAENEGVFIAHRIHSLSSMERNIQYIIDDEYSLSQTQFRHFLEAFPEGFYKVILNFTKKYFSHTEISDISPEEIKLLVMFSKKLILVYTYFNSIKVFQAHPESQKIQEQKHKQVEEDIFPNIFALGNFLDNPQNDFTTLSAHEHIALIIREFLVEMIFTMYHDDPQTANLKEVSSFFKKLVEGRGGHSLKYMVIQFLQSGGEIYTRYEGEEKEEKEKFYKDPNKEIYLGGGLTQWQRKIYETMKMVLSLIDNWEMFLTERQKQSLELYKTLRIREIQEEHDAKILAQEEERERKKQEREASRETAISFIYGIVRVVLRRNNYHIQETVSSLKREEDSEILRMIQLHHISILEIVQQQVEGTRYRDWQKKQDMEWQQVCSVLAEFLHMGKPIIPHFLQGNTPTSRLALDIMRWEKAELIDHLPSGVYSQTLDDHLENYRKIGENKNSGVKGKRSRFDEEDEMRDRDSNKRLEQEISMRRVFYKSTGAVPAWWLAPDWKRVALLRDVLWGELKKNKLKKEALLQGFDELLAQCDREGVKLNALKYSRKNNLVGEEKERYEKIVQEMQKIMLKETFYVFHEFENDDGFWEGMAQEHLPQGMFDVDSDLGRYVQLRTQFQELKERYDTLGIKKKLEELLVLRQEIEKIREIYERNFVWSREQREEWKIKNRRKLSEEALERYDFLF